MPPIPVFCPVLSLLPAPGRGPIHVPYAPDMGSGVGEGKRAGGGWGQKSCGGGGGSLLCPWEGSILDLMREAGLVGPAWAMTDQAQQAARGHARCGGGGRMGRGQA